MFFFFFTSNGLFFALNCLSGGIPGKLMRFKHQGFSHLQGPLKWVPLLAVLYCLGEVRKGKLFEP